MPTISIITPAYNAQQTIGATIESVLAQTEPDFELIIIDDGSQDDTVAVVQRYPDPRIRLFSYANAGIAVSRNRGLAQAQGELIASLDADDLWQPTKLAAQRAALAAQPEAGVAYSWCDCIDEQGRWLRRGGHRPLSGNVLVPLLLSDITENGSNVLIRRSALDAVGSFDESLTAGQDWDLYIRLAARYPFVLVPEVHVLYRVITGSVSANLQRLETNGRRVIAKAFTQAPPALQPLRSRSLANLYKYLTYRALQKPWTRAHSRAAAGYWVRAIAQEPALLRTRVNLRILARLGLGLLLPGTWLPPHLQASRFFSNFQALLGYISADP